MQQSVHNKKLFHNLLNAHIPVLAKFSKLDGDFHHIIFKTTTSHGMLPDLKNFKTIGEQTSEILKIKVGVYKKKIMIRHLKIFQNNSGRP